MNTGEIVENGAWSVSTNEEDGKVFIQSDDFTHDIRLYVNGDFKTVSSAWPLPMKLR